MSGAYCRALLDVRLLEETERARRAGSHYAVCLLDVDHFKSVNDAFGHARGDQVLRQVVERIDAHLRGSDAVFRLGGDEFVLLLPDADKQRAADVSVRVLEGVSGQPFDGSPALQVTISLGVACLPEDANSATELLAVADRRSYLAKHRGRDCVVVDDRGTPVGAAAGRLLERDSAIAAAHAFLGSIAASRSGSFRVAGQRGAGHSRFLDEIAHLAKLRGFDVVRADAKAAASGLLHGFVDRTNDPRQNAAAAQEGGVDRVLIIADGEGLWPAAAEMARARIRTSAPGAVGLVLSGPGSAIGPVDGELPLLQVVELGPWSAAAVRVWLRTRLRGEPSTELVDFVFAKSGGLPARAARTLDQLVTSESLRPGPTGWTFTSSPVIDALAVRALPAPLTELVGRGEDIDSVVAMLRTERLLTLVGPGGIGKTRLAVAVAEAIQDRYEHGAVFVSLADAVTPAQVESAVAHALDVTEVPGQLLSETIGKRLAAQHLLLILDNFERVQPAAMQVSTWLQMADRLTVLVTSRERLRLSAERVYAVPGLTLPPDGDVPQRADVVARTVSQFSALQLFASRAQRVDYDFAVTTQNLPAVVELCRRLDCLPLAIELAAARVDAMPPEHLLARLTDRLDLPGPVDAPARHQTLRATIEWSYDLLGPAERGLFTSLAVFAGGARLDAIRAVCPTDLLEECLATLVEKNLLRVEKDHDGEPRYFMLDTIATYAAERLAATAAAEALRARHAEHYAHVAGSSGRHDKASNQTEFLELMDREHANIRSALRSSLDQGDAETAGLIALGGWHFWGSRGYLSEGRAWLDEILDAPEPAPAALQWKLANAAASLLMLEGNITEARSRVEDGLRRARDLADPVAISMTLRRLSQISAAQGEFQRAQKMGQESLELARAAADEGVLGTVLCDLCAVELCLGRLDEAAELGAEGLVMMRAAGDNESALYCLANLGEVALFRKDTERARGFLAESIALSREVGDARGEACGLHHLGHVAEVEGNDREAIRLYVAALSLRHEAKERLTTPESLEGLAGAGLSFDPAFAARLLGAAEALRGRHHLPRAPVYGERWEALVAALREQLGPEAFADMWESGRQDHPDDVVAEALVRARGWLQA